MSNDRGEGGGLEYSKLTASVMALPTSGGTHSTTSAQQPACSRATASSIRDMAASTVLPWARKPPGEERKGKKAEGREVGGRKKREIETGMEHWGRLGNSSYKHKPIEI